MTINSLYYKKCIKDEILIDFLIVIVNVSFIIFFILNILL